MTTSTTIGQLYKQQGKDGGGITVKKEFAVPFDAIYIIPGFNAKNTVYRDVVEGMKNTLRKGGYLPKMIVEPDRDTPGISANICAIPTPSARFHESASPLRARLR